MPRVVLGLLRHGAYDQPPNIPSAHLPYPLAESGLAQARAAAAPVLQQAASEHWEIEPVIDSSRLLRAWQTASLLAEELQTQLHRPFRVTEFEALAERSVGAAANLTVEQIAAVLQQDPRCEPLPPDWQRNAFYRLPFQGAESLVQAGERVAVFLEERAADLVGRASRDVLKLVVGHGGSFRFAAVRLGVLRPEEAAGLSMHYATPVFLERRDAFTWVHVAGAWKERAPATTRGD